MRPACHRLPNHDTALRASITLCRQPVAKKHQVPESCFSAVHEHSDETPCLCRGLHRNEPVAKLPQKPRVGKHSELQMRAPIRKSTKSSSNEAWALVLIEARFMLERAGAGWHQRASMNAGLERRASRFTLQSCALCAIAPVRRRNC